jgi:deoxycytidylate deaminase
MTDRHHKEMMLLAFKTSKESNCKRLKVGCVANKYTTSFNHTLMEADSCTGEEGKCGCIHAEMIAIQGNNEDDRLGPNLYITHSPCVVCAQLIVINGCFDNIYYCKDYRDKRGLTLLQKYYKNVKRIKLTKKEIENACG